MKQQREQAVMLCAPLDGEVVPLSEVADQAFATGVLGEGVAILPTRGVLCAPADGQVDQVFDHRHAITFRTGGEDGAELLLHIGIDTVMLKGEHFTAQVKAGERVEVGRPLIEFDLAAIRAAGYDVTTSMVVSNSDEFDLSVCATGRVTVGTPLVRLSRRGGGAR